VNVANLQERDIVGGREGAGAEFLLSPGELGGSWCPALLKRSWGEKSSTARLSLARLFFFNTLLSFTIPELHSGNGVTRRRYGDEILC
jgi:hypothetical protein